MQIAVPIGSPVVEPIETNVNPLPMHFNTLNKSSEMVRFLPVPAERWCHNKR